MKLTIDNSYYKFKVGDVVYPLGTAPYKVLSITLLEDGRSKVEVEKCL